jgi:type VI secretion system protein ImpH
MGAENGQPDPPVNSALPAPLRDHPGEFSFFQAIRLLEQLRDSRLGVFNPPSKEPVELSAHPSLAFPAAEIQSLEESGEGPPRMAVNFFGLMGPLGMLPTRYTELIIERTRAGDTALRDFLDIFNHRLISLLYRAWEHYRYPIAFERGQDPFTEYLFSFIGLGTPGMRNRQALPDRALVSFEGLLAQYPRSAQGFRQVLAQYFEVPVEVLPFAGAWWPLEESSRSRLTDSRSPNMQLGAGMVLGAEVWDQQTVVRVRLGPLPLAIYQSFLPGGDAHQPLRSICRFFCGEDVDVEVQLILARKEAPQFSLDPKGSLPVRLGWVSWMIQRPLERDPDETVLKLWE